MKKYIGALLAISSLAFASETFALSNGDILASSGIVVKQSTEAGYRLNDFVLRQEVVGMAIKLSGQNLPDAYSCKGYFTDVTRIIPNNWACRAVEISADAGLVTRANATFRPEGLITKAEALAILMTAGKVNTGAILTDSSFMDVTIPWQINITENALQLGVIGGGTTYLPNQNATRGEIFEIAKRLLDPQVLINKTEIDRIYQEMIDLLGLGN